MTQAEFAMLSLQYGVSPYLALENPDIVEALEQRNDKEVERILREDY